MKILLLSDIHGNFPALQAIEQTFPSAGYEQIINAGDATVYAPFANQTLRWLKRHKAISILGNTDLKVKKLLQGKNFKKPSKAEKRIMYTSTAEALDPSGQKYLCGLQKKKIFTLSGYTIGLYHGSPEHKNEFLFANTAKERFRQLAKTTSCDIIITGHSHTPYYKKIGGIHFINPGSVGRMFDGQPQASWATLTLSKTGIVVEHHRCPYPVEDVVRELAAQGLPKIYAKMYRKGQKLN